MGKFGFPSRRKGGVQTAAVEEPPMSKAHKILGSTPLSIDGPPKDWGKKSHVPQVSISESLAEAQGLGSSFHVDGRGAESDGAMRDHLRGLPLADDRSSYDTDGSDPQRTRLAMANPWYDKFRVPPGPSQHASNTPTGHGLPPKAERLLDINGLGTESRSKKKPARLDFSNGRSSSTATRHGSESRSELSTSPPSIMSPQAPSAKSSRNRLQKRSTKESLTSPTSDTFREEQMRGRGSDIQSEGVPDLYRHYEQMSYRQVMDAGSNILVPSVDPVAYSDSDHCSEEDAQQYYEHRNDDEGNLQERPFIADPSHLRQYSQATVIARTETVAEPDDRSDSISSRHTRTSRITDKSSQDFHEKSVLMLSSDSEGDEEDEGEQRSIPHHSQTTQVPSRQSSSVDHGLHTIPEFPIPQASIQSPGVDRRASKLSRHSKRSTWVSYSPFPRQRGTMSPMSTPTAATFEAANEAAAFSRSSSRLSSTVVSPSPAPSRSWIEPGGLGVPTPRPVPQCEEEQGDVEEEDEDDGAVFEPPSLADLGLGNVEEMGDEEDAVQAGSVAQVVVTSQSTNQPTPPLSPTSASAAFPPQRGPTAHEGGSEGQRRYMSVTPEEEMLLAALRQKRQQMQGGTAPTASIHQMGLIQTQHQPSRQTSPETTSDEQGFDFDFPTPPKSNHSDDTPRRATSVKHRVLSLPGVDEDDVIGQPLSAPLAAPQGFSGLHPHHHSEAHQTERILVCMDKQVSHDLEQHGESEPSPDVSDLEYGTAVTTSDAPNDRFQDFQAPVWSPGQHVNRHAPARQPSLKKSRPHARDSIRHGNHRAARRRHDAGVPRPDSPVDVFPPIPSSRPMVNKEMARLSAVGPPVLNSQFWHDED